MASDAAADDVRWTERPLVLPQGTWSVGFAVGHDVETFSAPSTAAITMELSLFDELSVRVAPASVLFNPPSYGSFRLGATLSKASDALEPSGAIDLSVSPKGTAAIAPRAGLTVHASPIFRFDIALAPTIVAEGRGATFAIERIEPSLRHAPGLPIEFWFNLGRPLALGVLTGLQVDNVQLFEATGSVPLGLSAIATIPTQDTPLLDLRADFSFPQFHTFVTAAPEVRVWEIQGSVVAHAKLF